MRTKIIAFYLPQFHQIHENDVFWGEGYTDWVAVRNAHPLFPKHLQPRIPYGNNYYDLSNKKVIEWQAKIAKKNGIYGFGIYHYWFNNEKNLLTKPAEILLKEKNIDIHFLFAWDNASWRRSWSNVKEGNDWAPLMEGKGDSKGPAMLVQYILGTEQDWIKHYKYLLPFFKDERYIKKGNCPIFNIIHYSSEIDKMCSCWNDLARNDGFDGIHFIFKYDFREPIPNDKNVYLYEPINSGWAIHSNYDRIKGKINRLIKRNTLVLDYDIIWKKILKNAQANCRNNVYLGGFVSYDDSPRRGAKGKIVSNSNPEKFKGYLNKLVEISESQGKDFLFLTAWNEWGEGAYLEPDTINGYSYLNSICEIML